MRNIKTGLQRPAAQPDLGPRVEYKVTQTVENSVPNVMMKHAEQKQDLPLTVNDNTISIYPLFICECVYFTCATKTLVVKRTTRVLVGALVK